MTCSIAIPNVNFDAASDAVVNVLDLPGRGFILTSKPSFEADIVASNLPLKVLGMSTRSDDKLFLTLAQGVYTLDLGRQVFEPLIRVPYCSGSAVVTTDGGVLVARNHGVGRLEPDGTFRIIGGGVGGNFRAAEGEGGDVWVLSDGSRTIPMEWGLIATESHDYMGITKLGEALGDEDRHIITPGTNSVSDAAYIGEDRFFIFGHLMGAPSGIVGLDGSAQSVWLGHNLSRAITRLTGTTFAVASEGVDKLAEFDAGRTVITATHGIEISLFDVATRQARRVAQLNVRGSDVQLGACSGDRGYLYILYPARQGENAGALISWRYS